MDDRVVNVKRRIGRPALSFIRIYFDYNEATGRSKCKIGTCETSLAGRHSSNLEKHITRHHPEEAHTIMLERLRWPREQNITDLHACESDEGGQLYERPPSACSEESIPGSSGLRGKAINRKRRPCNTIQIQMDKKELIESCIELVVINGNPFTIFEDSGFQRLVAPIVQALREKDSNFSISRFNIQQHIQSEANHIREYIKSEVKGHIVSVKVDNVTRLDRSIISVNVQLCRKGKVVLRNLGVKEIFTYHTAENLQREILNILEQYGIVPSMVYSIITDNASYLVRTVPIISEVGGPIIKEEPQVSDEDRDNMDDEGRECNVPVPESDEDEDNMDNERLKCNLTVSDYEEWPASFTNLPYHLESVGVVGLQCAAHTFQLAVCDVLKCESTVSVLNEARNCCRMLRTPSSVAFIETLGRNKPVLDYPTRWQSTLDMIDTLWPLQDVCKAVMSESSHNKEYTQFSESFWEKLGHICHALQPARIASKKLQAEQLLVGDFLEVWLQCKYNTCAIGSPLALTLHSAMEKREKTLFESPPIVSALYLDCRWHVMLSTDQRKMAEDHLLQVWNRIQQLMQQSTMEGAAMLSSQQGGEQGKSSFDDYDDDPLERMLRLHEARVSLEAVTPQQRDVRALIHAFANTPRIPRTFNILEYWETKKNSDPELYLLATTVLAIPVTQVSVEMTFSHLKFVLNSLRNRLDSCLVNDMFLVRCNRMFQTGMSQFLNEK